MATKLISDQGANALRPPMGILMKWELSVIEVFPDSGRMVVHGVHGGDDKGGTLYYDDWQAIRAECFFHRSPIRYEDAVIESVGMARIREMYSEGRVPFIWRTLEDYDRVVESVGPQRAANVHVLFSASYAGWHPREVVQSTKS